MERTKQILKLFQASAQGWSKDNASMLAAGLAYYTIFAIAPLLVIAVAVAGFIYGDAAVEGQIVEAIQGSVGREAAVVIQNLIARTQESSAGIFATVISVVLLFLGASGLFLNMQKALDVLWGVAPPPDQGIAGVVKQRLLSLGMVLGVGLLLILSFALSTAVSFLDEFFTEWFPVFGFAIPTLSILISLLLLTIAFAMIFKLLPDAQLVWRDVFLGAFVTAVLFSLGRYLISIYLSRGGVSSTYGAAGSLVLILLFVYYSMQIILFGAEFTQAYANQFGSKLIPAEDAQVVVRREPVTMTSPAPPPPVIRPPLSPAAHQASSRQLERQVAAGLLGLALGLFLAFIGGRNLPVPGQSCLT
jgi:membrane protein